MAPTRASLGPHAASPVELQQQVEADRLGEPYLLFRDGEGAQRILTLTGAIRSVSVGRGPSCEVSLPGDSQVSRVHAQLERVGDDWIVVDDGMSRNGTFVNAKRVTGRRRLRDGDVLHVGLTPIVFRAPAHGMDSTASARVVPRPRLSEAQRRVLIALCRPYRASPAVAVPATNREIAEALFLGVETVKTHMRALFESFEVESLPNPQKRVRLVERAFQSGAVIPRDLDQ